MEPRQATLTLVEATSISDFALQREKLEVEGAVVEWSFSLEHGRVATGSEITLWHEPSTTPPAKLASAIGESLTRGFTRDYRRGLDETPNLAPDTKDHLRRTRPQDCTAFIGREHVKYLAGLLFYKNGPASKLFDVLAFPLKRMPPRQGGRLVPVSHADLGLVTSTRTAEGFAPAPSTEQPSKLATHGRGIWNAHMPTSVETLDILLQTGSVIELARSANVLQSLYGFAAPNLQLFSHIGKLLEHTIQRPPSGAAPHDLLARKAS